MPTYTRPFRLRVHDKLVEVLSAVSVANGYKYNLANSVFRGRLYYGESDPLPLISILEPPTPIEQLQSPSQSKDSTGDWVILLQGFVKDDALNPTDNAHFLMADVKKALIAERKRAWSENGSLFGFVGKNVVLEMNIGPGIVRPSDDISAVAYFWLTLTLRVKEDLEDPYS